MSDITIDYAMALIPKFKLNKDETTFEALKSMLIPELKEDFSNYEYWHHAVWFHLEFYGLRPMVTRMRMYFPHGLIRNDFDTEEEYQLFLRHKFHAYSIVFSKAANVIRNCPLWSQHYSRGKLNFCPCQLMDLVMTMKDSKIPAPSPAYEGRTSASSQGLGIGMAFSELEKVEAGQRTVVRLPFPA